MVCWRGPAPPMTSGLPRQCAKRVKAAFAAAQFLMDYLKTDAPFWKKETTGSGERWVEAQDADDKAKARWS